MTMFATRKVQWQTHSSNTPQTNFRSSIQSKIAIRNILRNPNIQTKLQINSPNDKYEKEADSVADKVINMSDTQLAENQQAGISSKLSNTVQRMTATDDRHEEEEQTVQTKAINNQHITADSPIESQINQSQLSGKGQPLSQHSREYFEPRFGSDFSHIRVHNDKQSHQLAASLNAKAFTLQNHIVFGENQFNLNQDQGKHLLAHELTHTIQQGNKTSSATTIQKSDLGYLGVGGRACHDSPGGDEWALVGNGQWQRITQGNCTDFFEDCDGMTCGGGFYYISNLQRGTCRTPGQDDSTFAPRRWTPTNQGSNAKSPRQRGGVSNTPPGYVYTT